MTSYEDIFERFKKRIEDKDLYLFSEDDQNEMMTEWLDTAVMFTEFEGLRLANDFSNRDNDLQVFYDDLSNAEQEALAMLMVVAWYDPKINSLEHTLMFVGSKDEKWTSQKEHLEMMTTVRDRTKLEVRKLFRDYGYKNNSYFVED